MTLVNEGNIDADLIIDLREKEGIKEFEGVEGLSIELEKRSDNDESALMQSLERHPDEEQSDDGSNDDSFMDND